MPIVKSKKGREIKIPKEVWESLDLKSVEFFEVVEESGRIVLAPKKDLDEDQLEYWSEEVQKEVNAAMKEVEEGKTETFDDVEDAIKHLKS